MARGKSPALTAEQEASIVERFDAGVSATDIANGIGSARSHIYSILRRYGRKPKDNFVLSGKEPKVSPKLIVAEYHIGKSMEQVAASLGIGYQTVRKHLLRSGVAPRAGRKVASEEELALYNSGMSASAIAEKTGDGNYITVLRRLRMSGVTTRYGVNSIGEKHHNWKGGKVPLGKYFAVKVYQDDPMFCMSNSRGYVMEHRLVLARHLGRPLEDSETVHHINGDTHDNRVENLQLRNGQHGKHSHFQCLDCGSFNVKARKLA